jgi:hypothetical protein
VTPAYWHDFALVTGGASGALTGLLFVAVSLNAGRIAGHHGLRASAAQTLVLFIVPLVMATVLLAPDQPDWVLGTELTAIGLATAGMLRGLVHRQRRHPRLRPAGRPLPAAAGHAHRPDQRRPQRLVLPAPAAP